MDRRSFLLAAAAMAAGCSRTAETGVTEMTRTAPLGIQLYSVRVLMAADVTATLELIASTGYREVEFAGYFDYSPADLKAILAAVGLQAPSAHLPYSAFLESPEKVLEHATAMGHQFVVVPWLDPESRSLDHYRAHAENFNRWGELCKGAGIQFAYHNHQFEFEETEGTLPFDLLLAETDPSLVQFELDLAWARAAKADSVAYFKAWPGRFPMLHIKDVDASGNEADIGDGDVAFASIFEYLDTAGVKHGFIERDNSKDVNYSLQHNFDAIEPLWTSHMGSKT